MKDMREVGFLRHSLQSETTRKLISADACTSSLLLMPEVKKSIKCLWQLMASKKTDLKEWHVSFRSSGRSCSHKYHAQSGDTKIYLAENRN